MSAHTPGPWTTQEINHRVHVFAPIGYRIADCGLEDSQAAQSNARLIAAAPDLLEALQEAEARLHTLAAIDDSIGNDPTHKWVLRKVRAAIAKAEGQEVTS